MKLGQTLVALRKQNNMTQAEVAEALHISYQAVSKWERDESLPDITLLPSISELFHVSIDKLLSNLDVANSEELVKTDQTMDEDTQQVINRKITAIVNREIAVGMGEGRIPNAEKLAEKISAFFDSEF